MCIYSRLCTTDLYRLTKREKVTLKIQLIDANIKSPPNNFWTISPQKLSSLGQVSLPVAHNSKFKWFCWPFSTHCYFVWSLTKLSPNCTYYNLSWIWYTTS